MKLHENGARNSCGMCCTKIQHLNVHYGSSAVLSDINLHIHCGELTAIIGPNGAGKSTLLKAMLGVIPHDGSIIFTDVNGNQTSAPRIGYVPQFLELDRSMPVTVLDLFLIAGAHTSAWLGASKRARLEAREILASVNAAELLEHSIGSLSGGEMQRVLLALALLKKPDILLLDEPVSGVDQNGLALFYRAIDRIRAQYDLT
ncbi:MAG: ATP-binding cassette domain-containing protein, partial [Clostridia bacterium]